MAGCTNLSVIPNDLSVDYFKGVELTKRAKQRGYNFFVNGYVHGLKLYSTGNETCIDVGAQCFRSMRKSEAPHSISVTLEIKDKSITERHCTCKAGVLDVTMEDVKKLKTHPAASGTPLSYLLTCNDQHFETTRTEIGNVQLGSMLPLQRSCQGHYATLAEVEQQLEADYLINMAQFGPHVSYWLGGRDDAVEGKWQWSTNDQEFWYTAWAQGEPNGLFRENCLEMRFELNWQWNDESCFTLDHYICEKRYDFQIVG